MKFNALILNIGGHVRVLGAHGVEILDELAPLFLATRRQVRLDHCRLVLQQQWKQCLRAKLVSFHF